MDRGHCAIVLRDTITTTMKTVQIAIVTGATSGIGRAAAIRFARDGASVLAVGRDAAALDEMSRTIEKEGGAAETIEADVTASGAPARIVQAALDSFGGITTLVNAAGIIGSGSVEVTDDDQWDRMMDINSRAPFRLIARRCRRSLLTRKRGERVERDRPARVPRCARVLREQGGGRSTDAMRRAGNGRKRGADQRCESWRRDLQSAPPGRHVRGELCDVHPRSRETHPLGRPGEASEIADLIYFLASDQAGWITGETISIDGGRHLTCAR